MVVNKITVPGSHLVQQDLGHDKFIYNDQIGAVYQPDPNVNELQEGFFKYTIAPPLLSNFAWNNIKLNWSRKYDTTAPSDFEAIVTLEGILPDGRVELLGEEIINTLTSSLITEDVYFDLLSNRGTPTISKASNTVASGKVGLNLPKRWMYYNDIVMKSVWLNGWSKRNVQPVNAGSGTASSYPLKIPVSYISGMKNDFSDVRFTLPDARTPLCSYLESYTSGSNATFYVNYPDSNIAKNLFMYYGNSAATLHSNIDSVFTFADDFNDNSLNPNKWQVVSGGGGSVTETNGELRITSDGSNRIYARSIPQFTAPYVFDFKGKIGQNIELAFSWDGLLSEPYDLPNNGYYLQYVGWVSPARFTLYKMVNGSQIWLDDYNITLDSNYHNYTIQVTKSGTANEIRVFYDETEILYSFDAGAINTGYLGFTAREAPASLNAYYDFVRWRPYMATTPSLGTLAVQESPINISPNSASPDATQILYSNGWGIRRPIYFEVTEYNKTAINTNEHPTYTTDVFNLGYNGVDVYMALRLGVNVLADKNCKIIFNGLEYAYEVI
jgi:hypothetical protein